MTVSIVGSVRRRLGRRYRHVYLKLLCRQKSWRRVPAGFMMLIDPADFMDQDFLFGTYEAALCSAIPVLVRPGEVCVDVGAHKGYITLHMARAVGDLGHVVAVEPDPRAMEVLGAVCSRNGCRQVIRCAQLLSDADGDCEFVLSKQLGWSSRFPNEIAKPLIASTLRLETTTLDRLVEELGIRGDRRTLSFVKIDAEGSEPLILSGMTATLRRYRPLLWLEVSRLSLRAAGFHTDLIETPLRDLGYRFFQVRPKYEWAPILKRRTLASISSLRDIALEAFDLVAACHPSEFEERLETLTQH